MPKLVIIIHGTAISDNITISQINTKKTVTGGRTNHFADGVTCSEFPIRVYFSVTVFSVSLSAEHYSSRWVKVHGPGMNNVRLKVTWTASKLH